MSYRDVLPFSKPVGVTLCQFDSDLRHHVFRHEGGPQTEIYGPPSLAKLSVVPQMSPAGVRNFSPTAVPALADWQPHLPIRPAY